MRINHEYDRGGSLAYLAAYDVHRAHVIGHPAAKTGIVPFTTLVKAALTGPHAPPSQRTPPPPAGAPGVQRAKNAGRLARTSGRAARRQYISDHKGIGLSWNSRRVPAARGDASGGGHSGSGVVSEHTCELWGVWGTGWTQAG
jgi:hypothetical protein